MFKNMEYLKLHLSKAKTEMIQKVQIALEVTLLSV